MKLRELIEALQKAPPEALEQQVLMHWDEKRGCQNLCVVEAIRFKEPFGGIGTWQVVLAYFDSLLPEMFPEDERRIYLSDVSKLMSPKKKSRPRKQPA